MAHKMTFRVAALVAAAIIVAAALAVPAEAVASPPPTIPSLNVTAYLGRWYQVYQDLFNEISFQNNSFCATATYGADPHNASRITVFNWERQYNVTGMIRSIRGYAWQDAPATAPGKLTVVLFASTLGLPAPYWIIDIGPIINGQYQYAVVSDSLKLSLFVLTRDVKEFKRLYEDRVLRRIRELGYTAFYNTPVPLVQDGCTYSEDTVKLH